MGLQEEIRADLEAEVFGAFGKTVRLINKTTPIYNTWGEIENTSDLTSTNNTISSIVAVPYDILWDRKSVQAFGTLKEGEMAMAVKYDQVVNKGDVLTIDSDNFAVVEINKNYLPDNVVTILKLARIPNVI